ncbi:OsmC family protein [Actinotalea sp.]|uniref:OsmC family protein n=1 Tax=Actinotalea sp. TaxID=1872145 RepID=UPI003568C74F
MANLQFSVSGVSRSHSEIAMSVRGFEFAIDEPAELGGTNAGPNPVEFVLSALAGCINVVVHLVAKERGVQIDGLRVTVSGALDPRRFMGDPSGPRPGFLSVELVAEVDSPASDEEIDEILAIAESRCPVADNLGATTPVLLRRAAVDRASVEA